MQFFFVFSIFSFSLFCIDSQGNAESDLQIEIHRLGSHLEIQVQPPSGLHFNLKAPCSLESVDEVKAPLQPMTRSLSKLTFKLKPSTAESFRLNVFLCDAQNTFCRRYRQIVHPVIKTIH